MYVDITTHPSHRLEVDEDEKKKKEQKQMAENDSGIAKGKQGKDKKERKISLRRKLEDGLLLVVSAKIYGLNVKA